MFKRFWWVFLGMAGVGAIGGLVAAAVIAYVTPREYESEATIEVRGLRRSLLEEEIDVSAGTPNRMTSQVHGKEFQEIKSNDSLGKVVEKLELNIKWRVDKEAAIRILKRIVITQNIRDTDLISIRVRHTNKEDARDIAAEVTGEYVAHLNELEDRILENERLETKRQFADQEDKVVARRQAVALIDKERGMEAPDYIDAKQQLEKEQETLHAMNYKKLSESLGCVFTEESPIVHEAPQIAKFPVSPNIPLILILGGVGCILLSQLLALPVIVLLNRLMPEKSLT